MRRLLLAALLVSGAAVGQTTMAPCKMDGTDCAGSMAAASDTQVIYNDGGTAAGNAALTFNKTTKTLTVSPGSIATNNLTATALATPTITSTTPVLSKVGSITTVAGASLVNGDYFTVSDGAAYIFEFNSGTVTAPRIKIALAGTETADDIRDKVIAAINGTAIQITASSGGAATVTLTSKTAGLPMGTNTENVANAGWAVTGMVNPTAATTYTYKVTACLASGACTAASAASTTAAGHATLSAANYNRVVWGAVSGAATYTVYRTAGGATQGIIGTTTTTVSLDDTGLAGGSETAPTGNTTGRVLANNVNIGGDAAPTGGMLVTSAGDNYGIFRATTGFAFQDAPGTYNSGIYVNRVSVAAGGTFSWSSTVAPLATNDLFLTRAAAATLQLGAAAANADGVDQVLQTQGGITGTDRAAGDLTIRTGLGTGAGKSAVIIQTPNQLATGTTTQTQSTRGFIPNAAVPLTDATATTIATIQVPSGTTAGGEVAYTIRLEDATPDYQVIHGRVHYAAANKAGTVTASISAVGSEANLVTAGTMTNAVTAVPSGATLLIKVAADTTLTPAAGKFYAYVQVLNDSTSTVSVP